MLPQIINVKVNGYRGYGVVKFYLKIFQRKDGQWVVTYSHDGAAIVVFNDFDKDKAISDMEEYIKNNKVNERKVFQI